VPASAGAVGRRRFDPTSAANQLHAVRRILFADHEEPLCWWMKGIKYGMVGNVTTPLCQMEAATLQRCRHSGPNRFVVNALEIVYCTDFATGALRARSTRGVARSGRRTQRRCAALRALTTDGSNGCHRRQRGVGGVRTSPTAPAPSARHSRCARR
jgi:hypothetical protein